MRPYELYLLMLAGMLAAGVTVVAIVGALRAKGVWRRAREGDVWAPVGSAVSSGIAVAAVVSLVPWMAAPGWELLPIQGAAHLLYVVAMGFIVMSVLPLGTLLVSALVAHSVAFWVWLDQSPDGEQLTRRARWRRTWVLASVEREVVRRCVGASAAADERSATVVATRRWEAESAVTELRCPELSPAMILAAQSVAWVIGVTEGSVKHCLTVQFDIAGIDRALEDTSAWGAPMRAYRVDHRWWRTPPFGRALTNRRGA